jgi:adenylyltransferase/sulfurtransferase
MTRVLLVGAGGLGSPVALLLARRGGVHVTLLDDDVVDRTNLHRQTLYDESDVGERKTERAAARMHAEAKAARVLLDVEAIDGRLVPENAAALVSRADLVIEGTDNLATKFLVADAAFLAGRPAVHAGVVRWTGWALASKPGTSACLRCLFEDLPRDRVETCADAGVVGPLVGVVGALEASLALRALDGDEGAFGTVVHVDALRGRLRRARVAKRPGCPLCGTGQIRDVGAARYLPSAEDDAPSTLVGPTGPV